ncbi:6355_t:CDS:2, partial [Gigaspora rosea]
MAVKEMGISERNSSVLSNNVATSNCPTFRPGMLILMRYKYDEDVDDSFPSRFSRVISTVEPMIEEGTAGRQLVNDIILPSVSKIKSNELRANEIEALSLFEKGVEELDRVNPDLILTTLVEILSRLKK